MSTNANAARARRIVQRLLSRREQDGPYSVFGRIKRAHIPACAETIAAVYPATHDLSDEDLKQAVLRQESRNRQWFDTLAEVEANLRKARIDAQNLKTTIQDVDRRVLADLSAREKLEFANEDGKLPSRIVVDRREGQNDA